MTKGKNLFLVICLFSVFASGFASGNVFASSNDSDNGCQRGDGCGTSDSSVKVETESSNTNTMGQTALGGDGSVEVSDAFKFSIDNSGSTSIGGWLHASGMTPGLPDIPLHWKLVIEQYNEANPNEIFASMPDEITRDHVEAYKETVKEEMGWWDRGKLERNTNRRSFTWVRGLKPTNKLRVFPGYPNAKDSETGKFVAKKGRDYKMICRLIFNSEDEIVYREDLAIGLTEWGMNKGANALIVTGFGARRVFDTDSDAMSLLGAFGQVFTSGWTGAMNVTPGFATSSGSNQTLTLPYLRVTAVELVNPEIFNLGMLPQKTFDDAAEKINNSDGDVDELRGLIKKRKVSILNCPEANQNNVTLRYEQGIDLLLLATYTIDESESNQALVDARDNFSQALRDGAKGQEKEEINRNMASIWYAMAERTVNTAMKDAYYANVRKYAVAAGDSEVYVLIFNAGGES